jgi:hypothetical protein
VIGRTGETGTQAAVKAGFTSEAQIRDARLVQMKGAQELKDAVDKDTLAVNTAAKREGRSGRAVGRERADRQHARPVAPACG